MTLSKHHYFVIFRKLFCIFSCRTDWRSVTWCWDTC